MLLLALTLPAFFPGRGPEAAEAEGPDRPTPSATAPVDAGAPVTSFFTSPPSPDGDAGWFRSPVLITLTAADPEGGPVVTYYSWGVDPPSSIYAGSFALPTGANTLYYRSVDAVGNQEPVKSQEFRLDTAVTAPVVASPLGSVESPALVRGSVSLEASAQDSGSGVGYVAFFRFAPRPGGWEPVGTQIGANLTVPVTGRDYRVPWDTFTVDDGLHRLQAQVRDRAGNAAFSDPQYVLVDNTSPQVDIGSPAAGAAVSGAGVAISGGVSDVNPAGWAIELRKLPEGQWIVLAEGEAGASGTLASLDTTTYGEGEYELRLRSSDLAGNVSQVTHSSIRIDNTPPTLLSGESGGPEVVDVTFSEPLDEASVAADRFAIDGLEVSAAALQLDGRTVSLTTSAQEDGREYRVRVAQDPGGLADQAGNSVTAGGVEFEGNTTDTRPPAAPQAVQALAGDERNLVTWSAGAEPDLAGYHLYRDADSQGGFATRVNQEPIVDETALADQGYGEPGVYWYAVTAVDRAGNESTRTAPVSGDVVRFASTVGPGGGDLRSSTGELALSIPPGALGGEETIQIEELAPPVDEPGFDFVSPAYELGPAGLALDGAAVLTMAVGEAALPSEEGTVRIVYLSESGWRPVEAGSTVDEANATVSARLAGLTRVAAALVDSSRPSLRSIDPAPGSQDVPLTSHVTLEFDEAMDPASLTAGNLLLTQGGRPVELEPPVFSADLQTVYLYPSEVLEVSTEYAVLVRGGAVRDVAGNGLAGDAGGSFETAAAGVTPHDAYLGATQLCPDCHDVEGGREPSQQTSPGEKKVCYVCHDGTGSSYNVKTADSDATISSGFGEYVTGSSARASLHPVPQPASGTGVTMLCSNCHNAHPRDGQGARMLVVKKLAADLTGPFLPRTENEFCWTCHEESAEASAGYISTASWNASTGFDHKSFYPAPGSSHNSLSGIGFQPETMHVPTVQGVACKACHAEHASENSKLVAETVNGAKVSFSTATDAAYNATYNGLCAACHEAPGVGGSNWPGSTVYQASGHGASPATKALTYSPPVPAVAQTLQTGVCKQCHEPHGAGDDNGPFANLTRYFEQAVCFTCHGAAGNPEGAKNLQTVFGRTNRHDLDMSSSRARKHDLDAEQSAELNPNPRIVGAARHVECADCHNTHYATGAGQGDSALHARGSNAVSGALLGVWGVEPAGGEAWSSSSGWDWAESRVVPATREYQICLKCHSAAAYGPTPPARPQQSDQGEDFWNSNAYTDQATEFNPANPSYHAVWGESKASGFGTYRNGWTASSRMYCSDCHRSSTAGDPVGAHGSATPFMLGGNTAPAASRYVKGATSSYVTAAERDADSAFCYECHDPGFASTGFSTAEGLNLHTARHETDSCTTCHAAVPHGWRREHLLITRSDPAPYNDHGSSFGIPDSATFGESGQWTEESCHNEENTGCHSL